MSERRSRRRGRAEAQSALAVRQVNYRRLRNPFPPMEVFSRDEIANMHETALRTLEELGMKVLLREAVEAFRKGGARIDGDMVFIGRDMVEHALKTAPKSIEARAGARSRDLTLELGSLMFQPGAGAPHATDLERGRRPGSARNYIEYTQLNQHFDVLQMLSPSVESQDIETHLRHYFTTEVQLTYSDKFPFVFSRGTPQVMDCFEMIRDFRDVSDAEFAANPHCYTIINTNSPRTLDIPMAQGLIDFAKHGQMSIVTPFTLMGAMAPITVAGAITLSHAEALAAITLTQLVNPGAPICYGTFTSNVDMKSGAPAFGTPTHFQASLAAGQLARLIGLPWRSAAGSAANLNDVQAANENQMGLWGCLMAGATVVIHSAGWLEGGLSVSYEKIVTDVEVLNMVAELCAGGKAGADEIGFDNALSHVDPSGHFFAAPQTMARYSTEFYEPIVHDYSNFGTWTEAGAKDASTRATQVWKDIVSANYQPPADHVRLGALKEFIVKRTEAGGRPARKLMDGTTDLPGNVKATRADWLEAAMEVLITGGVSEVKILKLSQKLGVSRSSFYWYFESRKDLLSQLLKEWERTNTGIMVDHAKLPADTITGALNNFFRCVVDPKGFNHKLDFAIREWARRDAKVRTEVDKGDAARHAAIAEMFRRHGYREAEADIRARVLYYQQIGYYALELGESLEERLARAPGYVFAFTGVMPSEEEIAEFEAFARASSQR